MMINESILIIERVEKELKEVTKQIESEIMQSFPSLLSYDLMTGIKYYISHDLDPPWDHSGTLLSCPTNRNYKVENYEKVEDFFEEYTGNSVASYISHHGLSYETYGEKYSNYFADKYRNAHYDYFNKLENEILKSLMRGIYGKSDLGHKDNDTNDLISKLIDGVEGFEDMSFLHAEGLCSKISGMDLLLLYKRGEQEAKERLRQEQVEREYATKMMRDEENSFHKRWHLLENKYRLAFQKPFPKRIEMRNFESFQHFLDLHHVSKDERALIAKYAPISFSNTVFDKLRE